MRPEFSGIGDPTRGLPLLWRTKQPPARGPKPGLSIDTVVDAAIMVADSEGLEALSMSRVANEIGVGTMTLYTYVPAKAELLDLMVDAVSAELAEPREMASGWRAGLELVARDTFELLLRHRWMTQVVLARPVFGPGWVGKFEQDLRAIDGIGLTDVEMDAVWGLTMGQAAASARAVVERDEAEGLTGMSQRAWWRALEPVLDQVLDARQYPLATRVGMAAADYQDPRYLFEFGLGRLLDGIELLIKGRVAAAAR